MACLILDPSIHQDDSDGDLPINRRKVHFMIMDKNQLLDIRHQYKFPSPENQYMPQKLTRRAILTFYLELEFGAVPPLPDDEDEAAKIFSAWMWRKYNYLKDLWENEPSSRKKSSYLWKMWSMSPIREPKKGGKKKWKEILKKAEAEETENGNQEEDE